MTPKLYSLIALTVLCLMLPLSRLADSPTLQTARAVDLLLVFAAGIAAGVLLVGLRLSRRA